MTSDDLHIYVLDVGQGDAMILHQPGTCAVLIDAGPPINGHRVTGKLEDLGISTLDMVIVTHPHLDHFAGLFDILPRIPTRQFSDNARSNDSWEYFDDYTELRKKQPYQALSRGMQLSCGDIAIDVLHPPGEPDAEANRNDESTALLISYRDFNLLHMGDVAGRGEQDFIRNGNVPHTDILKIGHHGAADSTSDQLLAKVSPKQALISTATHNRIGSPAGEVLERLERNGIDCYRTDMNGDITIRVSSGDYTISTERGLQQTSSQQSM